MDKIVDGFTRKIGSLIHYNTKVLNIDISNDGVTVVVENQERAALSRRTIALAIFPCRCSRRSTTISIPFSTLPSERVSMIRPASSAAGNERFWEDTTLIGIRYTDDPTSRQMCESDRMTSSSKEERHV